MKLGAFALLAGALGASSWSWAPSSAEGSIASGVIHVAGAPPGNAGADGEPSCHVCHNELELNEPDGRLDVLGFPERYEPGAAYAITVSLASAGTEMAGFQAAVRGDDGRDAGALASLEARTTVVTDSLGRQYVGHNAIGIKPTGPDGSTWLFEWVAPGSGSRSNGPRRPR